MGKTLGLGPERRIKQGRDFLRIRSEGKRFTCGCLIANWALAAGLRSRVGVITGRKMGNAVARARARRLLREAFRLHQGELRNAVDLVLVARPSIVGKEFQQVERDLLEAFRKGRILKETE